MVKGNIIEDIINFKKEIDSINDTRELYLHEIKIESEYYYLELNPIHIENYNLNVDKDQLQLTMQNNRRINLKLTDDFSIKLIE